MKVKHASKLQCSDLLLDQRNLELLRLLRADTRMSLSALARRIGMSAPAVRERLARLEEGGVIQGYQLAINPAALGFPIAAMVRIRPMPGKLPKIVELAQSIAQISECHRITGEDCFVIKLHLRNLDELDPILDRFLAFGQTTTSLLQSSPVPPRALPLPDEPPK
jgi:Lrp/AsnC family transcriptional regulator, leucine-responsive regulatory protein